MAAAFRAGAVAGLDGEPLSACPHCILSPRWWAWLDGWNHGGALRRRVGAGHV